MEGRTVRLRALSACYKLYPESGSACVYCGIPADTYDHVPALAILQASDDRDKFNCYLVPSCRECNTLLGTQGITVLERRHILKKKLRKRYAAVLKCAEWSQSELDDLGRGLRDVIEQGVSIKDWVKRRIAW